MDALEKLTIQHIQSPLSNYSSLQNKNSLIYNNAIDTSTIQNVLFINSSVTNFQQYANANTFPIVYSRKNTLKQLLELLTSKFQNISRIAIVCHFSEEPYFLNNETLFSDTNIQFIIDLVKQFNVKNLDFLACSTLQSQVWTSYYTKLHDTTCIPIGASNDNTGNLKYGGDWIMESIQEDVQTIYFNDQIQKYASLLEILTIDGINYTTDGSNASVSTHTDAQVQALNGIINIPNTITDENGITYTVTTIGEFAFFYCTTLTSVTIPISVTTIGSHAIESGLVEVITPVAVTFWIHLTFIVLILFTINPVVNVIIFFVIPIPDGSCVAVASVHDGVTDAELYH